MVTKFFGASVVSFSESLGWGSQQSQLDVTLAECQSDGDVFTDPVAGAPATFSFYTHTFNGLVDKYSRSNSSSGDPLYSVNLTSGSELLDGVQLILDDYYGVVQGVPNLINVFGYLENGLGFGGSATNDAGMSWSLIATTLDTIINSAGNSYGGPITYKGYSYGIDLSELPVIPDYYRISGDNISLMAFIQEICEAGGTDFYIRLEPYSGGLPLDGVFVVKTISRVTEPSIGAIANYISSATGCIVSTEIGVESRIDTTSKFILGDNVEDIYYNWPQNTGSSGNPDDTPTEYEDNTIMPFVGFDINGNAILGSGDVNSENYYFDMVAYDIGVSGFPVVYTTSIGEMAAAKKGRETWEKYLAIRNFNEYVVDPNGASTAFFVKDPTAVVDLYKYWLKFGYWFSVNKNGKAFGDALYPGTNRYVTYKHNGEPNPYFQRASQLQIVQPFAYTYMSLFESDMQATAPLAYDEYKESFVARMVNFDMSLVNLDAALNEKKEFSGLNARIERVNEIYKKVKELAEEYYNRKYMVRIPFTLAAIEPESFKIRLSQEPIGEGYLSEEYWPFAYASGFIPDYSGINKFSTTEGKLYPYIKFNNAIIKESSGGTVTFQKYDFSEVPDDSKVYTVSTSGSYNVLDVFIKCDVDDKIVFLDQSVLYSPRAVMTLPGPVKQTNDTTRSEHAMGDLRKLVALATQPNMVFNGDAAVDDNFIRRKLSGVGVDALRLETSEALTFADLYAVPLRNNLLCYGPWWAIGASGKVEYERNTELSPWNYDGFTNMNTAGLARANDSLTYQTLSEAGSITYAGTPLADLGDQLIAGGPYISNINVNFGDGGTTTQYQFQTWSSHRRFSKLNLYNVNRIERLAKTSRELRRNFRDQLPHNLWRFSRLRANNKFLDLNQYPRRLRSSTSHHVLTGQSHSYSHSVVTQPFYNTQGVAYEDWEDKAIMSIDGLLRPYSTVEHSGGLNFFGVPATGDNRPSSLTLNPLNSGHDINILSVGYTPPSGGLDGIQVLEPELDSNDVLVARGMGMKLPMVGVGYSYDINGHCVQFSGDDQRKWSPDYNWNHTDWKAGPIDFRWDNDFQIYTMPKPFVGIAMEDIQECTDIFTPSSGMIARYIPNGNSNGIVVSSGLCWVIDKHIGLIEKGTLVSYSNIEGYNIIWQASCDVDDTALGLV